MALMASILQRIGITGLDCVERDMAACGAVSAGLLRKGFYLCYLFGGLLLETL